ncbi:MAG: helix-turn-helix domain-containing protein [Mariprofundales bacterium]
MIEQQQLSSSDASYWYDIIPRAILRSDVLRGCERSVWGVLKSYCAGGYERAAWPSVNTIAKYSGYSVPTVENAIDVLQCLRWLHIERGHRDHRGKVLGNVYILYNAPLPVSIMNVINPNYAKLIKRKSTAGSRAKQRVRMIAKQTLAEITNTATESSDQINQSVQNYFKIIKNEINITNPIQAITNLANNMVNLAVSEMTKHRRGVVITNTQQNIKESDKETQNIDADNKTTQIESPEITTPTLHWPNNIAVCHHAAIQEMLDNIDAECWNKDKGITKQAVLDTMANVSCFSKGESAYAFSLIKAVREGRYTPNHTKNKQAQTTAIDAAIEKVRNEILTKMSSGQASINGQRIIEMDGNFLYFENSSASLGALLVRNGELRDILLE